MKALIDADLVAFRCAFSCDDDADPTFVTDKVDFSMEQIIMQANATKYEAFLTGKGNFRKKINPEYKANRKDKAPPKWLQTCRDRLTDHWKAEVCTGYEADDALGMNQTTKIGRAHV